MFHVWLYNASTKPKLSKSKKRRLRRKNYKQKAVNQSVLQDSTSDKVSIADAHQLARLAATVSVASREDDISLLCTCNNPVIVIPESQLSQPDPPVFYHEENNTPGICVDRHDGSVSWSPVKISRSAFKVGDSNLSEDSDLDVSECLSIEYEPVNGSPGFCVSFLRLFWHVNHTNNNK